MLAAIFATLVGPVHLRVLRVWLEPRKRPLLDALRSEAEGHWGRPVDWAKVAGLVDSTVLDSSEGVGMGQWGVPRSIYIGSASGGEFQNWGRCEPA
jgi:hypothetical protein